MCRWPVNKDCLRLNYTVRSTGAPVPPGLVLDSATGNIPGTFTGEIMEEFLGLRTWEFTDEVSPTHFRMTAAHGGVV